MTKPVVRIRDRGDCYLGEIELPMETGKLTIGHVGWSPLSALKRAASTAMRIATDPAIAPFLPAPAMAAIQTARSLSKMSPAALKAIVPQLGPAGKVVATKLLTARAKRSRLPRRIQPPRGMVQAQAQPRDQRSGQQYDQQYPEQYPAQQYPAQQPYPAQMPQQVDPANERDLMALQAWGAHAFDDQSTQAPYGAPDPFAQYEDPYAVFAPDEGGDAVMYEDYFDPAESE